MGGLAACLKLAPMASHIGVSLFEGRKSEIHFGGLERIDSIE